jgi:ABC-type branched-subunit amino acid transport system ATPase component
MSSALVVQDIRKRFGDSEVLAGVRASAPEGRITAFIGPNGAGKTTLFHVIAGALKPDSGRVWLHGQEITGLSPSTIARMGLGRQFQDVRVFPALSVTDNVIAAMLPVDQQDVWWTMFHPFRSVTALRAFRTEAQGWIEFVGLADEHHRLARELSFGQQKLLALARLFAAGFSCLLLDEPTAGVSEPMANHIVALIRRAVAENSLSVVAFIEHNMTAVEDLADWIHFLHEGRVAFSGSCDHVLGDREVRETYMGI